LNVELEKALVKLALRSPKACLGRVAKYDPMFGQQDAAETAAFTLLPH